MKVKYAPAKAIWKRNKATQKAELKEKKEKAKPAEGDAAIKRTLEVDRDNENGCYRISGCGTQYKFVKKQHG